MAMPETTTSAAGVTWDLGDLFAGPRDPEIERTLQGCKADAEEFARTYRGTIAVPGGPAAGHLSAGIERMEDIFDRAGRVASYSGLLFAANTADPVIRDLEQKVEQRLTELRNLLLFFDLEWLALEDDVVARIVDDPALADYRHYLVAERRYRPHKLSEPEEKIVNEKNVTGASAWERLFTEMVSSLGFPVKRTVDGKVETQDLNLSQTLALYHEPDRETRKNAHDALFDVLAKNGQVLTFTYDTLVQDHLTMDRLRQYPNPMLPRHLANEIAPEAVEQMMRVVEANYPIAHDYFKLKAKLVGLPKLMIYDQYAPVGGAREAYSFDQARETIVAAFGQFSPRFAEIAGKFFDGRWIDAEVRKGKQGGAFCASPSPKLHPYVLTNYTDNLRDAMTVAHELGHGIHGYVSLGQKLVNYHPTLPLAETASVFGEMLVFERLLGEVKDDKAKLALLCGKVEDAFATVFRQNVLTRFEQSAFAARSEGRLEPEKLQELWIAANAPYYGDGLEMSEGYRWGWSYIPHFVHTPFYCYAYVFGELLVLALYGMYREQGAAFVPEYTRLLERGGSESPAELLKPLGVDFREAAFWQKGFDEIKRLVAQAESLA